MASCKRGSKQKSAQTVKYFSSVLFRVALVNVFEVFGVEISLYNVATLFNHGRPIMISLAFSMRLFSLPV